MAAKTKKKPAAKKPAAKAPAVKTPAAKTPAAKKPAANKPAPKKPTPAPKAAGRSRGEKKTLVFVRDAARDDKPTIPIPIAEDVKARAEKTTKLEKVKGGKVPADVAVEEPGAEKTTKLAKVKSGRVPADAAVEEPGAGKTTKLEKVKGGKSPSEVEQPKLKGGKGPAATAEAIAVDESGLGWVPSGKAGYQLTLDGGKLACRNDKGKRLSSVPKDVRDGDVADQLEGLRDWLAEHDRECVSTVEQWMLRSLPVPRAVLQGVWADPAWRKPLENAVVVAVDDDGGHDHARAGLFRGVDPKKGVGVVDLDGETAWLEADRVAIPHPILIADLDGWRDLITQLGVQQGISQLHRETHTKPADPGQTTAVTQFEHAKFNTLMQAVGKARSLGYKIRGGFATCLVWDGGTVNEARYWIGADSPEAETYTGHLSWVDGREKGLAISAVGPVAFSEGMRMASAIYAARVVEKQEGA